MSGTERLEQVDAAAEVLVPVVAERLEAVRERLRAAGGDPARITIVAVTKTFGPEHALAAVRAGCADLGENYASELVEKAELLAPVVAGRARWHFIGQIQRNKVGRLAPHVDCWQTLSRAAEAESIARHAGPAGRRAFVEVNLSGEAQRTGCRPDEVPGIVAAARAAGLAVTGVMAVAPLAGAGTAEGAFAEVVAIGRSLGLEECSIGMSGDLEAAVRAGTTMVRVGTALFGARDRHAPL